jgi:hypothetical protein
LLAEILLKVALNAKKSKSIYTYEIKNLLDGFFFVDFVNFARFVAV